MQVRPNFESLQAFLEAMRATQLKLLIARLPRILHLQPKPAND